MLYFFVTFKAFSFTSGYLYAYISVIFMLTFFVIFADICCYLYAYFFQSFDTFLGAFSSLKLEAKCTAIIDRAKRRHVMDSNHHSGSILLTSQPFWQRLKGETGKKIMTNEIKIKKNMNIYRLICTLFLLFCRGDKRLWSLQT